MTRRVLAISDAAAGNRRQAQALAAALGYGFESLCLRPRAPWRWFAPRRLPAAAGAFGAQFRACLRAPWPDLVIGCGRQAALATRLIAGASQGVCRSVQILDPRIAPHHYDAVVVPHHDGLSGANVITLLGSLNEIDERWLQHARNAFPALSALPAPCWTLLLGGPTSALKLDRAYWDSLVAGLRAQLQQHRGSLMLSSSRRTPDWLRAAAREAFADLPGLQWHGPSDGPNPYAGMLACAEAIVVTPDSVNMLSEAAATCVPVFFHAPQGVHGKVGDFVSSLQAQGRILPLGQAGSASAITPLRETDRVASRLIEMLGWQPS